ncbi:MAG: FHA domain-containing protein [Anaerolineae bacterium]|nr:FHA domain-containing protein [Anaerolineae bacterium]
MSTDVVLLVLRVLTGALLLVFLAAVFVVLWRDYRTLTAAVSGGTRQYGRLVVLASGDNGIRVNAHFPLLPLTTLGRSPTNTVVLDDTFCSQEHALLTRRGGQWWLEDRDSSNGTWLNGEPVREAIVVSSGDVIGIGDVQLKIELE